MRQADLHDASEYIGAMEDGGEAAMESQGGGPLQRHQGEIGPVVPSQSERNPVEENRDLPAPGSAERRLLLAPGVGADLYERKLPKRLPETQGGRTAPCVQRNLDHRGSA